MERRIRRIGFLLFPDCDLLDFSGPAAVFHSAARHINRALGGDELAYTIDVLSIDGGLIRTMQTVSIDTEAVASVRAADLDTIVITGGTADHLTCDPRLIDWIRENHDEIGRVASVCCGSFLLAAAGALDGRPATTHWEDCARLQESFPTVKVQPDSIFIRDGKFWTAAGITAGIDMALAMVEQDYGHALSLIVARNLVVFLKRPGGQSQFSAPLQSQSTEGPVGAVLDFIVENPSADLSSQSLADRAGMSLRNFYRAFEAATGTSPAEWIETARVEIAKRRLEESADKIEQVAVTAGFRTYEQMRRTFAKRLGISPTDYRSRFGKTEIADMQPSVLPSFFENHIRLGN
jgi:transcriptional regulator GlxA family with amidase domain